MLLREHLALISQSLQQSMASKAWHGMKRSMPILSVWTNTLFFSIHW
jgi:hypothetical protein